ncbi:MAG: hypothetical protein EBZ59_09830 [Planctomycetia bacterium]|nr:hypothetical protein [Planctomycetia bacterium]
MQGPLFAPVDPSVPPPPAGPGAAVELGWFNGRFLERQALCLPVGDAGFVMGATVTEQLRTFGGRLFLPTEHRERLRGSLEAVGIEPPLPLDDVFRAAAGLAARNHAVAFPPGRPTTASGDLGLVIFATPGNHPAQHRGDHGSPLVAIHSFPLAFATWARAYREGAALRSVSVRQVPEDCWPIHAKVRSRLHYFLADREAGAAEPGARAVLCHADGRVSETSTANIAIVHDGVVSTPPPSDALAGVSLRHLRGLAEAAGLPWRERSLATADLAAADEILLTSTPSCVLPATRLDGRPVGDGRPGPVHALLLAAWSRGVGLDIAFQARSSAA